MEGDSISAITYNKDLLLIATTHVISPTNALTVSAKKSIVRLMPRLHIAGTNQTGHHVLLPSNPGYLNPSYIYDQQGNLEIYG